MRRFTIAAALLAAVLSPALAAGQSDSSLQKRLGSAMRGAGSQSGAYVMDAATDKRVFGAREGRARILASNTKLFTTAAVLAQYGAQHRFATEVLGDGQLDADGVFTGDLYLRGGGDPTFGSRAYVRRSFGSGGDASVEDLAAALAQAGIQRVRGRVLGDESKFDARRSGRGAGRDGEVGGQLSGLIFNRGFSNTFGSAFQATPAVFAAAQLDAALGKEGVPVSGAPRAGRTPGGATVLATEQSSPVATLIRLTNKPSDNYIAEMLLKDLALDDDGGASTAEGATDAENFAEQSGSFADIADGSGLSRGNRAAPKAVAKLLDAMLDRDDAAAWNDSLTIAGRDGTLAPRMRRGPARGRCRGKTGTLRDVSALSGYCESIGGRTFAFSIIMNSANPASARSVQDRMAQALAGSR
ncbi:MAG: D-alanyl-D-alanine carboxypeptidase/D-alanyl-D-alanine-endopeptidase [Thermoleophilaceae bacterium]|nr:D-alanyl-D-alanine carboxypeptidase/D-alanyl-D-alanine-endopeptidase [Thermoleophilaceae bacterium]